MLIGLDFDKMRTIYERSPDSIDPLRVSAKDCNLQTRTLHKQVTFARPFRLLGFEGAQPPGTFALTIEEEQLDVASFVGWHQVSATLELKCGGATEYFPVDMQDLREALLRDTGQSTDPPNPPSAIRKQPLREFLRRG
jgi:hypothetical protein